MISGTRYRLAQEIGRQQRLSQEIARAQSDISTKTRIQRPSDDPAAAARVAQIRQAQADEAVWAANVETASALANRVDGNLASLDVAMVRAKELMLSAGGALSAADRATIAAELKGIAEDIAALSQETDARGQRLFTEDAAILVPIGRSLAVAAGPTLDGVFTNVPTPDGPADLVDIVNAAADALLVADPEEREAATATAIAAVSMAGDRVADARGEQGVRAARFDTARERLAEAKLTYAEERSGLEDTNIEEAVIRLNAKLIALEAAQAAFARTSRSTLFDLLR